MYRILVFIFIATFSVSGFGQTKNQRDTFGINSGISEKDQLDNLIHLAMLQWEKGQIPNGDKFIEKIIDFELGKTDPNYQAFYILGKALLIPYKNSERLDKIQESIELARLAKNRLALSSAHTYAGIYHRVHKNDDKAIEHWHLAIEVSEYGEEYHLKLMNGWAKIQMAMMMIKHEKEEEATKYAEEGLQAYLEIPDGPAVYFGYYELGNTYALIKNYKKALQYFHKAIPLMPDDNPFIHNELAYIYEAQGEWGKAAEYYEYSTTQYKIINKPTEEYLALSDLGRMIIKLGNIKKAAKITEELGKMAENNNAQVPLFRVHSLLADIAKAQNNQELAIKHYQTSMDLQKDKNRRNEHWEMYNHLRIGQVFLENKNYKMAIKHCLKCKKGIEEIKDFTEIETVYLTLYQAYKNSENDEKALENLEQILKIREGQAPIETAKQLQQFEFAQKIFADSLAQVEKDFKLELAYQNEIKRKNQTRNIAFAIGAFGVLIALGLFSRLRYIRKTKRALEEKNQIIEAEKEKAKASEKAKQQFLANMSHEIRTPMNAIKGMTDILLRRSPEQKQMSYLNAIKESSNSLLVIINDILDISKIEAGKIALENIPFSMKNVIQNVLLIMQFRAEEKGLMLGVNIENEENDYVLGDPTRLHQTLINLAGNAIKFTEKGKVTIQLKKEKIAENKINATFCVADTGIGISKNRLEKIFESFEQAYSDTTRKFGGTGLGLSISKKLVEIQEGSIWVESEKNKGSHFFFSISYEMASQKSVQILTTANEKNAKITLKNLKILLVEDNQFNAIVAQEELEDAIENVAVEIAENGLIALEKVKENDFDIILMDVQMPVMNGYSATQEIRKLTGEKSQIPIIAMTANVMKSETERCFKMGMNDFIGKPFDTEVLLSKIQKLITP